ncbi:MAG: nitroreductase family protein [Candidatus Bathyarchaeia archaeon]
MPNLSEVIKNRRSIRKFKPDPIPEEVLFSVLEAARWAPSWANTQCWEFILIKDVKVKEELSKTLKPKNPAIEAVKQAPVVIAALGRRGVSGFYKGSPVTDKGDWLMFDVALAVQNLILEAHNLGLGSVIIGALNFQEASKILNLPENIELVALIPIGYPDGAPKPTSRKEISNIIHYDKYSLKP